MKEYKVKEPPTSRYRENYRYIYDDGVIQVETSDRIKIRHTNNDIFFPVTEEFKNRLDLVSYKFYGTTLYWWGIAAASDIYNPFDVPIGTVLRVPPIEIIKGVKLQ